MSPRGMILESYQRLQYYTFCHAYRMVTMDWGVRFAVFQVRIDVVHHSSGPGEFSHTLVVRLSLIAYTNRTLSWAVN